MAFAVSALSLFLVTLCVFAPMFGIALAMLRSARRAFSIAAVFALGSVAGFWIAAGVLATWLLHRKAGLGR